MYDVSTRGSQLVSEVFMTQSFSSKEGKSPNIINIAEKAIHTAVMDSEAFPLGDPGAGASTAASFKIGKAGARAFLCFDSGKCAVPVFENPSDPAVVSLLAALPKFG
jgi:hypothetical protein